MQIQVNHSNQIQGGEKLTQLTEAVVESTLGRFGDRITRVEVHFSDENSSTKSGDNDKRCLLEARLAGLQPISVTHNGSSIEQALDGAIDKLEQLINRTIERLDDPHKRNFNLENPID